MTFIPYGRQQVDESDIEAVVSVLKSNWLTQGPAIEQFEKSITSQCGSNHAVAVSNGTAALHLACLALDLGPGDYLWTSPNTFVASANCALYCGASVDFVDIELDYYNMSVSALESKLIEAEKIGRLPKVVVPVHFSGQPCDMKKIKQLADKYGFYVIEDASHAIGAQYEGSPVGNCKYSDMTTFSFHPVKIITTGEGGAVTTNNNELHQKICELRTHGITRDQSKLNSNRGPWYYEQHNLGYNYRMTDIQAALGCSQLNKLDDFIQRRHEVYDKYTKLLSGLPIKQPKLNKKNHSALHLYPVLVDDPSERRVLFEHMRENNIGVNVHYIPVYKQPYYQSLGFSDGYCENAEYYYARELSLPMYPGLKKTDLRVIVDAVGSFFARHSTSGNNDDKRTSWSLA
jgi:UDP-4-amino-4,6-dideoxy-N-acetyl-beta-L-altrosamine transaminase